MLAAMSVRAVHHLSAATMCPRVPARLLGQRGRAELVAHCLVLETARDGLILVDTGFGTADVARPDRLPRTFRTLTVPKLERSGTVLEQLGALGYRGEDVRHIALTHLDLDHAGGLSDFPHATVHLHQRELAAATAAATARDRQRYRPVQWAHGPVWRTYQEAEGDTWRGVPAIRQLEGISAEISLLPMPGHSRGHSAVLVAVDRGYLLHAGDAYFHRSSITEAPAVPLGLRLFERIVRVDARAHEHSVAALRELRAAHADLDIFCAHDPQELARHRGP